MTEPLRIAGILVTDFALTDIQVTDDAITLHVVVRVPAPPCEITLTWKRVDE
jgi:hypothetical protein